MDIEKRIRERMDLCGRSYEHDDIEVWNDCVNLLGEYFNRCEGTDYGVRENFIIKI